MTTEKKNKLKDFLYDLIFVVVLVSVIGGVVLTGCSSNKVPYCISHNGSSVAFVNDTSEIDEGRDITVKCEK